MAILTKKNIAKLVEYNFIKQQLFPYFYDFKVWPDGSIYMDGDTLVFDLDKLDGKYPRISTYQMQIDPAKKALNFNSILFKGSKIQRLELDGSPGNLFGVKVINQSTAFIVFTKAVDASYVEGNIFFNQPFDYIFSKQDIKNINIFQVRTEGYLHKVRASIDNKAYIEFKKSGIEDPLVYLNNTFKIPENIHFSLGNKVSFIKGIKNRKELDKYLLYGDTPNFILHPQIEDLYYYV